MVARKYSVVIAAQAAILMSGCLVPLHAGAQTLDQKAWNAVWDRLNRVLPNNTATESVHALEVIIPATWASGTEDGLRELQQWASAIPEPSFSVDPSRLKLRLHDVYARVLLDVDLPMPTDDQRKRFRGALNSWNTAFEAFMAKRTEFVKLWKEHQEDLKARSEPVNSQALLKFRTANSGFFTKVQGDLDDAMEDVQKYAPVANYWVQAVRKIRNQVSDTQSMVVDVFDYDGGFATLGAIKNDCNDTEQKGWDRLTFNSSINAVKIRSSGWNGNGGWDGSFFNWNLGGGGSNYEKVVRNNSERVDLQFCNLTYVSLRPGGWFDYTVLKAIDEGKLKLKDGSPYKGKKLVGPDGEVGRLVKGAVVARSVQFIAKLDKVSLDEIRKSSGGSGGVRIGPWRIGGRKGSSEFKRELQTEAGTYGRATATTVPVVLAIITEPTQ